MPTHLPWRRHKDRSEELGTATRIKPTPEQVHNSKAQRIDQDSRLPAESKSGSTDLWDKAYRKLTDSNPRLVQEYERTLVDLDASVEVPESSTTRAGPLLADDALQLERRCRAITQKLLENFEEDYRKHDSRDDTIKKRFLTAGKVVVAAKDFISSATSQEPHAAIAWAGICILLPLFMNPLEQNQACQQGIEAIPFIVRRLHVMEKTVKIRLSSIPPYSDPGLLKLLQDFETHAISLHQKILEYLIRLAVQSRRGWAPKYGRNVLKLDDWMSLLREISDIDSQCTRLARDITINKVDQEVTKSNRILETQSRTWQANFDTVQQKLQESSGTAREQFRIHARWRQSDEERACHQAFRLSLPYEDEKDRVPRRASNTCSWFLNHATFLNWKKSTSSEVIWVSGKPGAGKSVLAKSLIEEKLLTDTAHEAVITYFFFKDASPMQKKITSAIAGILHQLFTQKPQLIRHALREHATNGPILPEIFDAMWTILKTIAEDPNAGEIICVLDALDECDQNELQSLTEKILELSTSCQSNQDASARLKFLLTGRPYSSIRSKLYQVVNLDADQESESIKHEIDQIARQEVSKLVQEKEFPVVMEDLIVERLLGMDNQT